VKVLSQTKKLSFYLIKSFFMRKYILLTFTVIADITAVFSQQQQWVNRVNGKGNGMDAITAMVVDKAGNVYVTGYLYSGANDNDYVTIKYNSAGVQQWRATYNGPGNGSDVPSSVFVDNAGNTYVTGTSDALTGTFIDDDVATVKYNSAGVQQWVARCAGSLGRADAGNAVKADAAGNVYITGYTTVRVTGNKKVYLTIKYNAAGVQQWLSTYKGIGTTNGQDDAAIGLALDAAGNVYVTGNTFAGTGYSGRTDYLTVKYNSSGVQQWTQQYNGPGNSFDYPTAIAADAVGNVVITGYSVGTDFDFATIKYNTNGVQQWIARYNGPASSSDLAYALVLDNAGNVYVTGSDQKVIYNSDYLTVKYNSSGVQQWTARYNGPANDNDEANALAVDKSGNVYVTGYINGVSPSWDIATIKYNNAGVQQWVSRYDGPKDSADVGNAIGVDTLGNVYVGGASTGKTSAWDYTTIKYASPASFAAASSQNITANSLLNIYPNPVHDFVSLRLPGKDVFMVTITDIKNRKLFEQNVTSQANINCKAFPAGTYFIKATNQNKTLTETFIKQ
jgi:uncharacterized delta-60 repeat protein